MQTDIPVIEPTPEPVKPLCRLGARLLGWTFSYGTYVLGVLAWYLYGWFYGLAALPAGFVILGIVRAKIRNISIPLPQQEYKYSDHAVAKWYVVRRLLCDL